MSNVWFTSDLHIGHEKVAGERLGPDAEFYSEHDDLLAENWDKVVAKDDVIWVLGDISSGTAKAQDWALDWLVERPGRKRLILGNHDGPHPMHRDAHKWFRPYSEVFEYVSTAARIRIPTPDGHLTALLSHFPYVGDHSTEDRHTQWRLRDLGTVLVHGHTHSSERFSRGRSRFEGIPGVNPEPGTPQIHVGVDAWDMRPVSLEEVWRVIGG